MDAPNLNECYLYFALTGHGFDPDAVSGGNLRSVTHIRKGASAGMRELLTLIKP